MVKNEAPRSGGGLLGLLELASELVQFLRRELATGLREHLALFLLHVVLDGLLELGHQLRQVSLVLGVADLTDELTRFFVLVLGFLHLALLVGELVGEDRIAHTPKDEELNLKIGNAFDVACERKQTDFQKIASGVYEIEYEITLRNHKATAIAVEVNEPIGGTWQMLRSSHQWTKTDAWAAGFKVAVASDGTAVLKYRVRVNY